MSSTNIALKIQLNQAIVLLVCYITEKNSCINNNLHICLIYYLCAAQSKTAVRVVRLAESRLAKATYLLSSNLGVSG